MALIVRNLRWLGVSVEDPPAAAAFFRDALGLRMLFDEANTVELETEEGDRVQLFGPGSRYYERGRRPFPLFDVLSLLRHRPPMLSPRTRRRGRR